MPRLATLRRRTGLPALRSQAAAEPPPLLNQERGRPAARQNATTDHRQAAGRSRDVRLALALLLLSSLLLSLWYGLVTPLGEGPDEPAHLDYILAISRTGRLPGAATGLDHPGEVHQPPLSYLLAQPLVRWLPADEQRIELGANPRWSWRGGNEPGAYFRRTAELSPYQGLSLAWHLVRAFSALLGTLTVGLTFLLAQRLGLSARSALAGAALLACVPQYAFQHGLVSNDPLLWTLSTATLVYLTPRAMAELPQASSSVQTASNLRQEHAWALGLGTLLGAALLAKSNALILLPLAAAAIWLRWRQGLLRHPRRATLLAAGVMLALSGWWFWRNLALSGDPLGVAEFRRSFATAPFDPGSAAHWAAAGRMLGSSLVARFGWVNLPAPAPVYWLALALALAGMAGAGLGLLRGHRPSAWALLLGLMPVLTLSWLLAFALTVGQVAAQGRFLFPALPVLALGLAWGLDQLPPRRAWPPAAAGALLIVAVLLPATVIRPAYRWFTSPPQPALDSHGRYASSGEPGIELRHVEHRPVVQAGASLSLRLTWHVLGRPSRNWTIFVHLARSGEDDPVVASDRQPFNGNYPMLAWTAGDWISHEHQLVVPADTPPGRYVLRIGLFDPQSGGMRAGLYVDETLAGDYVETGLVEVQR